MRTDSLLKEYGFSFVPSAGVFVNAETGRTIMPIDWEFARTGNRSTWDRDGVVICNDFVLNPNVTASMLRDEIERRVAAAHPKRPWVLRWLFWWVDRPRRFLKGRNRE